jgi:hypothetical protein
MSDKIVLRDPRPTKTVELPSFPGSQIEIWPSLLISDQGKLNASDPSEKLGMDSLPLFIKSWNFTNEKNEDMPINADSVKLLPTDDAIFLFNQISDFATAQKKS